MSLPINPYESPIVATAGDAPVSPGAGVEFDGALTVAEVLAAARLALPRTNKVLIRAALIGIVLMCGYVLWVGYSIWLQGDAGRMPAALIGLASVVCALTIIYGKRLVVWLQLQRMHRQGIGYFAHTRGRVTPERIESRSPAAATVLDWSGFCGYRAASEVAVLFQSFPAPYLIFGRSKFASDADWQKLLAIFAEKLPRR